MKRKAVPAFVSGFAIALIASVTLWQLLVMSLLVRAMTEVLGALGHLF